MNGLRIWCVPRTGHAQRGSDAAVGSAEPTATEANVSRTTSASRVIQSSSAAITHAARGGAVEAQNPREMRPVGERCYPFRSIPSDWDDYACPLFRQCR